MAKWILGLVWVGALSAVLIACSGSSGDGGQPDRKIVAAGGASGDFAVARVNLDATLDTSFNTTGLQRVNFGFTDQARAVAVQPDGKIVAGGFDDGGLADFALARLNADGSLDATFNPLTTPSTFNGNGKLSFTFGAGTFGGVERANAVALQPSGKIVMVGFTDAGGGVGANNFAIARINADGTLDTTFNGTGKQTVDFGFDDQAFALGL